MIANFIRKINSGQKGFGLIEIILIAGIGVIVFLGFEQYLNLSLKSVQQDKRNTEALYLAGSLLEQSRAVRDEAWANISSPVADADGKYHFSTPGTSPDKWTTAAGAITSGQYTMWVKNYQVERDVNKNIVSSGGVVDSNTLKVTATVSWSDITGTKEVNISEYLANYQ